MSPVVHHLFTGRRHGDLSGSVPQPELDTRRAALAPGPWTWLRQEHGARVVTVERPGHHAGAVADAAVTVVPGATLSVRTADCGALLLVSDGGLGVVHAGWQGLRAGVVEAAAEALAALGSPVRQARLGPCIRHRCYEFGSQDLDDLAGRYGDAVRATTGWGTPALDLAAGIAAALGGLGIDLDDDGTCTACSPAHWSHRARGDAGRQALVAWRQR